MPKQKLFGKARTNPSYDEETKLVARIDEARIFLMKQLDEIDSIKDITFQLICIFALLDCLAQEEAGYPETFKHAFCEFVLKYQKQCDFMKEVEPITLYYDIESYIDETDPYQRKLVDIKDIFRSLGYIHEVEIGKVLKKGISKEILSFIEKKKGEKFANNMAEKHRLISLLYRMRSKAIHEMTGLGEESLLEKEDLKQKVPYYCDYDRIYVQSGNIVSDDVIKLVIPNFFVRNILSDCIDGYLESCKNQRRFPFNNNRITRKHVLSWYD